MIWLRQCNYWNIWVYVWPLTFCFLYVLLVLWSFFPSFLHSFGHFNSIFFLFNVVVKYYFTTFQMFILEIETCVFFLLKKCLFFSIHNNSHKAQNSKGTKDYVIRSPISHLPTSHPILQLPQEMCLHQYSHLASFFFFKIDYLLFREGGGRVHVRVCTQ